MDARFILVVPAALLAVAVVTDVRARIIPNWLTGAIAVSAPIWWWLLGLPAGDIAWQGGMALAAFALFAGCFALGMMGGGDVKLIAALALWLPPGAFARMLVWMALAGGAVTLATLCYARLRRQPGRPEIPYGVAIAAAGLLTMANDLFTSPAA